jgi:hypothetical protein
MSVAVFSLLTPCSIVGGYQHPPRNDSIVSIKVEIISEDGGDTFFRNVPVVSLK